MYLCSVYLFSVADGWGHEERIKPQGVEFMKVSQVAKTLGEGGFAILISVSRPKAIFKTWFMLVLQSFFHTHTSFKEACQLNVHGDWELFLIVQVVARRHCSSDSGPYAVVPLVHAHRTSKAHPHAHSSIN